MIIIGAYSYFCYSRLLYTIEKAGSYLMIQRPRGTSDFLHMDNPLWAFVESSASALAHLYGYSRIDTPTFESADLFVRTIGDSTDIVQKEMYTFEDKGGGLLTLRAEGTAPVCRAFLEHGLHNRSLPLRLYYLCPVFRYERPQSGRYREHHQFGVELLGAEGPEADAEVIALACDLVKKLGLEDIELFVNSIGDPACRSEYLVLLSEYYQGTIDSLCNDCKDRFTRNPLRLLDCKNEQCSIIASGAPKMVDNLCVPCESHWQKLLVYLNAANISYDIDHRLVRGMDYYTRTVFELKPKGSGSQGTILGGGRYDGLIEQLGGKSTPGIGFGSGLERLVLNLEKTQGDTRGNSSALVAVLDHGDQCVPYAMEVINLLRAKEISSVLASSGKSIKAQMRYAASLNAKTVLIVGEDEVNSRCVSVKDMLEGNQETIKFEDLINYLNAS